MSDHVQKEKRDGICLTELHYMPWHIKVKAWLRRENERKVQQQLKVDAEYIATHPTEEIGPIQNIELPD